jgi:SAUR family protein
MLKSLVRKIQKGLSLIVPKSYFNEGVREGYFVVVAMKDGETRRFMIGLEYLRDPIFLRLLDQAREEYGFRHQGTLAVPCGPQELQNILHSSRG